MKLAKAALLGTLVVGSSVQSSGQIGAVVGGGMSLFRDHAATTVGNVPESLRNVPIHPDDTYVPRGNAGIIPSETLYSPPSNADLAGKVKGTAGLLLDAGRLRLIAAPYGSYNSQSFEPGYDIEPSATDSIRRRNYYGYVGSEKRGEGTALTYYRLSTDVPSFGLGAIGRASVLLNKSAKGLETRVYAEVDQELTNRKFVIENGWDRYNALESMSKSEFARVKYQYQKLGIEFGYDGWMFRFFGGTERPSIKEILGTAQTSGHAIFGGEVEFGVRFGGASKN